MCKTHLGTVECNEPVLTRKVRSSIGMEAWVCARCAKIIAYAYIGWTDVTPAPTITLPTSIIVNQCGTLLEGITLKPDPKCECRARAVGSNAHSGWCDMAKINTVHES